MEYIVVHVTQYRLIYITYINCEIHDFHAEKYGYRPIVNKYNLRIPIYKYMTFMLKNMDIGLIMDIYLYAGYAIT